MKSKTIKPPTMKSILSLLLLVSVFAYADPIINTPPPYDLCDSDSDGFTAFDLHVRDADIIMGQPNVVISYYETMTDAVNGTNEILTPTYMNIYPFVQTLYIRGTDTTNNTYAINTMDIRVDPAPIANTPANLVQEDIPYDGHSAFDLTINENAIVSGATGMTVSYFVTSFDAQAGTNAIAVPTAYVNSTNPQSIYVRVENSVTHCYNTTDFQLIVTNPDIVYIPDPVFKGELAAGFIATDASANPIALDVNNDGEIQVTEALLAYRLEPLGSSILSYEGIRSFHNVRELYLPAGNINSLDLSGMANLTVANCEHNGLTTLNASNCPALKNLYCEYNLLSVLNVSNCPALEVLFCGGNYNITTLDLTGKPHLNNVWCEQNQINGLDVTGSPLLQYLSCRNNNISTLDLTNNTALTDLNCGTNPMTAIDLSHCTNLVNFHCAAAPITSFDFTGLTHLRDLNIRYTNISTLDVSNLVSLTGLNCDGLNIPELDLSHNPVLCGLQCSNTAIIHLNIKNGTPCNSAYVITANGNLQFVCTDEEETDYYQTYFANQGSSAVVNSYCTFVPGATYNTISGVITFDADNNGCDASDVTQPNIRINITDGTTSGATFDNGSGHYSFFTQAGDFTIAPEVENPTWFTFTPSSAVIPFADNNSNIATQNFCLAPNGVHRDAEMVIMPVGPARPGFETTYKLVYKNKGNQTSDLYLNFTYDDGILDYVSSSATPTLATSGHLSFTVLGVQPFQSGYVLITLHLNSPTDTPPVNIGDTLTFTSFIDITTDENWDDNTFTLNRPVIGSFDPNAITCLEGSLVPTAEIGEYLHYGITFENTGNYAAENVVVKDVIDISKYDINSLQVLETSHPSYIRITGNIVEFVFRNINLAAASGVPPVGGHGDVLFKIKSKDTLTEGDYVSKSAHIYFDYNAPITTNNAETTFATLSNPIHEFDESVKIYPNPTHSIINISCNSTIQSVDLYDIQGRLLETDLANSNEVSFDISGKSNGVYFIKITSDKGSKVEKIVKE